jgi:hypothetical protein
VTPSSVSFPKEWKEKKKNDPYIRTPKPEEHGDTEQFPKITKNKPGEILLYRSTIQCPHKIILSLLPLPERVTILASSPIINNHLGYLQYSQQFGKQF